MNHVGDAVTIFDEVLGALKIYRPLANTKKPFSRLLLEELIRTKQLQSA